MKHVAFTGTQAGWTPQQSRVFREVFTALAPYWFHHGDCIGADAQAHDAVSIIASSTCIYTHPCNIFGKRAFRMGVACAAPLPPLDRNRVMIDHVEGSLQIGDGGGLIATPRLMVEELRSGTWATIRYARKRKVPVHIIWPDGTYIAPPPT